MHIRKMQLIFCLCGVFHIWGQNRQSEVGLITDNDLYTSSRNDMYYTNGLELFYRFKTKNGNLKIAKELTEFRLGQYIYSPRFIDSPNKALVDRPYAGYLFGEYGKSLFYKSQSVLKIDFQLGYVGPNAFGEEVQSSLHKLVGYKEVLGWENQIKNALAIQTHLLFSRKLFTNMPSSKMDLHWRSEANFGTILTGATTGFVSRIAIKKLLPVNSSNLYDGAIDSSESEFYFYIAPSINYQLYDASIQGSLFSNNSPITFSLVPWRFNSEAGFKYRKNNLNLSYVFNYRGKELYSKTISGYFYGSIGVSYLLK
jgi:hypothetical protein